MGGMMVSKLQKSIISDLKKYILEHIDEDLRIDRISKISGYSRFHIQRMWNAVEGIPLGKFIAMQRMDKACELLRKSDLDSMDISNMVGYASHQTYCRAFKQLKGMTPTEYRKLYSTSNPA